MQSNTLKHIWGATPSQTRAYTANVVRVAHHTPKKKLRQEWKESVVSKLRGSSEIQTARKRQKKGHHHHVKEVKEEKKYLFIKFYFESEDEEEVDAIMREVYWTCVAPSCVPVYKLEKFPTPRVLGPSFYKKERLAKKGTNHQKDGVEWVLATEGVGDCLDLVNFHSFSRKRCLKFSEQMLFLCHQFVDRGIVFSDFVTRNIVYEKKYSNGKEDLEDVRLRVIDMGEDHVVYLKSDKYTKQIILFMMLVILICDFIRILKKVPDYLGSPSARLRRKVMLGNLLLRSGLLQSLVEVEDESAPSLKGALLQTFELLHKKVFDVYHMLSEYGKFAMWEHLFPPLEAEDFEDKFSLVTIRETISTSLLVSIYEASWGWGSRGRKPLYITPLTLAQVGANRWMEEKSKFRRGTGEALSFIFSKSFLVFSCLTLTKGVDLIVLQQPKGDRCMAVVTFDTYDQYAQHQMDCFRAGACSTFSQYHLKYKHRYMCLFDLETLREAQVLQNSLQEVTCATSCRCS